MDESPAAAEERIMNQVNWPPTDLPTGWSVDGATVFAPDGTGFGEGDWEDLVNYIAFLAAKRNKVPDKPDKPPKVPKVPTPPKVPDKPDKPPKVPKVPTPPKVPDMPDTPPKVPDKPVKVPDKPQKVAGPDVTQWTDPTVAVNSQIPPIYVTSAEPWPQFGAPEVPDPEVRPPSPSGDNVGFGFSRRLVGGGDHHVDPKIRTSFPKHHNEKGGKKKHQTHQKCPLLIPGLKRC